MRAPAMQRRQVSYAEPVRDPDSLPSSPPRPPLDQEVLTSREGSHRRAQESSAPPCLVEDLGAANRLGEGNRRTLPSCDPHQVVGFLSPYALARCHLRSLPLIWTPCPRDRHRPAV